MEKEFILEPECMVFFTRNGKEYAAFGKCWATYHAEYGSGDSWTPEGFQYEEIDFGYELTIQDLEKYEEHPEIELTEDEEADIAGQFRHELEKEAENLENWKEY